MGDGCGRMATGVRTSMGSKMTSLIHITIVVSFPRIRTRHKVGT